MTHQEAFDRRVADNAEIVALKRRFDKLTQELNQAKEENQSLREEIQQLEWDYRERLCRYE